MSGIDYMQSNRSNCQTAFVGIRPDQTNQYEQTAAWNYGLAALNRCNSGDFIQPERDERSQHLD
jgi:hypothetical protein